MKRYYFDVREDNHLLFDDVGIELPDIETAHREGFRGLTAMASEMTFALASKRRVVMEVRDENGLVLSLSGAFESVLR